MKILQNALAVALSLVSIGTAYSQAYPTKPVRVIVGYPPGGGVDIAARLVASALSELWGNTALVDNRPGAAGGIGTEIAAKATPDGYTLMLCQIASHAINPARYKKLPYDHIRDFAPVSMPCRPADHHAPRVLSSAGHRYFFAGRSDALVAA